MRIVSLVLRIAPSHLDEARRTLVTLPGVQVHAHDDVEGKLIVTVEDGPGYSTADSILAVHKVRDVLSTTLAYEFGDDDTPPDSQSPHPHRLPAQRAPSCH